MKTFPSVLLLLLMQSLFFLTGAWHENMTLQIVRTSVSIWQNIETLS
jgi:hypothetical protein